MSRERFQSETGQSIDDNCCSLLFGNTSPLFYTVNPRSGISLRQQEQLGAASILKSFRDLPGCTRLSSSLTNLDSSSKRAAAPFPLLPDISQKGNMGKSLQGHHSSSKRFVRERYNPPFKVNAKIRHVYTQEVTTIEQAPDLHQNHHSHRHSGHHHHHSSSTSNLRNSQSIHDIVTCHRQTQTELPNQLDREGDGGDEASKQKSEVEHEHATTVKSGENNGDQINDDKVGSNNSSAGGEESRVGGKRQQRTLSRTNSKSQQLNNGMRMKETDDDKTSSNKVDASTSPIPSPFFPSGGSSLEPANPTVDPFSTCSQMTVYPPLNYVRKLEDLEKITGHIVIQRFFTKTDDAFGTWLERQLGMTSKSVSVDTSEFENAKKAELLEEMLVEKEIIAENSTLELEEKAETGAETETATEAVAIEKVEVITEETAAKFDDANDDSGIQVEETENASNDGSSQPIITITSTGNDVQPGQQADDVANNGNDEPSKNTDGVVSNGDGESGQNTEEVIDKVNDESDQKTDGVANNVNDESDPQTEGVPVVDDVIDLPKDDVAIIDTENVADSKKTEGVDNSADDETTKLTEEDSNKVSEDSVGEEDSNKVSEDSVGEEATVKVTENDPNQQTEQVATTVNDDPGQQMPTVIIAINDDGTTTAGESLAEEKEVENVKDGNDEKFVAQVGFITGAISNPGEGDLQETENTRPPEENPPADCGFTDHVKCECYLDEIARANEYEEVKAIEEQIVEDNSGMADAASEIKVEDAIETMVASSIPVLPPLVEEVYEEVENNKVASDKVKCRHNEKDIDEVVRCTLEAYLMAPLAFEDIMENDEEVEKENKRNEMDSLTSPVSASTNKSGVDSGRADSIQSQENNKSFDGLLDTEGNTTSHDSVETVYEIPISHPKHIDLENGPTRILQRCLSADSCIGTESSGDVKNQTTNASQSSNDTIEVLDPIIAPKELVDLNLGSPASAPLTSARSQTTKLPAIPSAKSIKNYRTLSSGRSQRSMSPGSAGLVVGVTGSGRGRTGRRIEKTDMEAEDADGESETESEITDNYLLSGRPSKHHHPDGTDLELEEVDEDEGDDDDRDAFDKMVANHLKYSRGLSTATATRRNRLNRGTQTTKSIEPSTTSGSISPCSSSNSSFDVEIISKSKRITTASTGAGGPENDLHHGLITPGNMTLAWHEGGRRRSYLPSSSSSLNLLNMKFSLGKDFESEVSIRMPTTNKSSMLSNNSANLGSASMMLPGSGGTGGKTPLMSSSSRTHHHHYQAYPTRGLSSSSHHSTQQNSQNQTLQSPLTSATTTTATMQIVSESAAPPTTELQSLWKDVRTKLDVQVDEIAASVIPEADDDEGLQVRGSGILPSDPTPSSGSSVVKMRRNEEKIKRSLQRLKKILDD